MSTTPPIPSDANAWDKARHAFAKSILVDTPLGSLAQDLDVPPWPINAPDETPAAYIYLPYTKAVAALAARGLPPAQLGALITLLNDTNAFDAPFEEMTDDVQPATPNGKDAESPLFKNLAKLELPEDFPLELSSLSSGTIELCRIEGITTLGGFVGFASRLSQSIIVGGDFRSLLNALAQKDEATLATLLPLRQGSSGLYLREAIALVARTLSPAERAAVVANPQMAPATAAARVKQSVDYFATEHAALRQAAQSGIEPTRLMSGLDDEALEPVVAALMLPHLPSHQAPPPPPKPSLLRRLFGFGR